VVVIKRDRIIRARAPSTNELVDAIPRRNTERHLFYRRSDSTFTNVRPTADPCTNGTNIRDVVFGHVNRTVNTNERSTASVQRAVGEGGVSKFFSTPDNNTQKRTDIFPATIPFNFCSSKNVVICNDL